MSSSSSLASNEEIEENEEMLLACVLDGDFLEEKQERPKY